MEAQILGRNLGEFIIRQKLGEGGFASVYKAYQPVLDREAVVKVLHQKHHSDAEVIERFKREARIASQLEHPYSAHIYAFGAEEDGLLWIAMEFVRGTPLDQMLKTSGRLRLDIFTPLLERICEVVQTAHEAGIVHRDLKPANVMVLSRAGRLIPKLLDFGIAKIISKDTPAVKLVDASELPKSFSSSETLKLPVKMTQEISVSSADETVGLIGSPMYMSPELWHGSSATAASDIYALGILSYEVLTGRLPFKGDLLSLIQAHEKELLPSLGSEFPPALDEVLRKATAKLPQHRYRTALEFAEDFRKATRLTHDPLPQLDFALMEELLANAPQPIADAVSALRAADSLRQSIDALREVVHAVVRYVGVLAMAVSVNLPEITSEDKLQGIFKKLRRVRIDDRRWVELAALIMKSSEDSSKIEAGSSERLLPELAKFFELDGKERLEELISAAENACDKASAKQLIRKLETVLMALQPLWEYLLVVPSDGIAKSWMGAIKNRASLPVASDLPQHPMLIGRDRQPILQLWPLVQVATAIAGQSEELFFFDGRGRYAARFVSIPSNFEIEDEQFWEWYSETFLDIEEESIVPVEPERSPYPGLSAFTSSESKLFFGREREIERALNRLKVEPLLTVVGASGAGKSSFVQAGILPSLDIPSVIVRPGVEPLQTLRAKLGTVEQGKPFVLVVDQFEELLTLCEDAKQREEYAKLLCSLMDSGVKVILTLRDDFLLRAKELPLLGERLQHSLELLSTPQFTDLVRIITLPALRAGYDFDDPDLPQEIAREVSGKTAALPLLAFTALKLWEKRDRRLMRRADYIAMGGVAGALAQHAEATLEGMTPGEVELARKVFQKLITGEGTRAVVKRSDLVATFGRRVELVVEQLVSARLLSASEDTSYIELVHEALLWAWPRLAKWRQEASAEERFHEEIRRAARTWDERGRPDALLWRGELLAELRLWRIRYRGQLDATEEAFFRSSLAEARRARRNRSTAALLAATLLFAGLIVLFLQRRETQLQILNLYVEQGRQQLQAGKAEQALLYLSQAYSGGKQDPGIRFMLARAFEKVEPKQPLLLEGHRAEVLDLAFSPDATKLASASADRSSIVWNLETGKPLLRLNMDAVVSRLAFSSDARLLATGADDGSVAVWDVGSGQQIKLIKAHTGRVTGLRFGANGSLISAGIDGSLKLWTLDNFSERRIDLPSVVITAMDFHEGLLLIASDSFLWIVDSATGRRLSTLLGHKGSVKSVSFSKDGRRVVSAGADTTVRLWDISLQAQPSQVVLDGHTSIVTSAVFSPDGHLIASCGTDRTVRFWEATGKPLVALAPFTRPLNALAYDPTGKLLAVACDDQTIWLCNVTLEERSPAEVAKTVAQKTSLRLVGERIETVRPTTNAGVTVEAKYVQIEPRIYEYETARVDEKGKIVERKSLRCEGYVERIGSSVLEMVFVPGGQFLMGSPEDEPKREAEYEGPQHPVTVRDFYMSRFEITQAQWQAVMGNNPANFKGDNLPVESIDWHEANEFCRRLSELTGRRYRLPTEAEWEYACRAGTNTAFHFGPTITTDLANYDGKSETYLSEPRGKMLSKTLPVGSYKFANAFGLYDMHGNVHEWCQDVLHNGYKGAPSDGSAWERPYAENIQRVLRGGSWSSDADFCRSAVRVRAAPTLRTYVVGLRVVADK
ncbi:MAG: SUMF1/EgtB/PvdO family nonheme iron enzyme [Acidobacteriota bacterium]|nr:SUMF1/EgtB/PvdO family nonheme iron enzyme [Blastocatellia bacterium]MDW8413622.1 SUMF1/EgtB/PvdO family nonheme iron enzyme [Acidobacteriota bacterium]